MKSNFDKNIYIVITQSGTSISKILKFFTKKDYNHVSISLCEDLKEMYSFGRIKPSNPLIGGFVIESAHSGTFKRFPNTKAIVLCLPIKEESYNGIEKTIKDMLEIQKEYKYNFLGILLSHINIHINFKRHFYCSEFVCHVLKINNVQVPKSQGKVLHPMEFMETPNASKIYDGILKEYSA